MKKYKNLDYCYVDIPFTKRLKPKNRAGIVVVDYWKGHMLLSVRPEHESHEDFAQAWLHGDDLDKVIKLLQEAKRVWLKGYKKTARFLKKKAY